MMGEEYFFECGEVVLWQYITRTITDGQLTMVRFLGLSNKKMGNEAAGQ
jgi:hypothetical protein